jgi:aspartyl-tRNA(Asn)/glutamyl-tRNA(Gln) amidotransferase subunit A
MIRKTATPVPRIENADEVMFVGYGRPLEDAARVAYKAMIGWARARTGMSEVDASNITEQYLETRRKGFGGEVRRRVMLGTYALSSGYYDAYYLKAQKVRTLIKRDFDEAFQKCDAIVSATSPTVAFPIGAKTKDPLSMYLCDVLTLGGNLAGLPGISVPCGTSDGLPVGLQVLAPQWGENVALRVARAYEQASEIKAQVADVV